MVAPRIVAPSPKLATTLAEDFGVASCDEDDLYAVIDCCVSGRCAQGGVQAPAQFGFAAQVTGVGPIAFGLVMTQGV